MYSTLFAFGDSLSDAGNDYYVDLGTDPVSPYYQGHFSNGLTCVEDLSNMLGLGALTPSLKGGNDFAFGGAETGPTAIEGTNPGDLLDQVAQYRLEHPQYQGALYTLDIGGNDIIKALDEYNAGQITLNEVNTVIAQAEANTVQAVKTLYGLGARNLLFYEVPDLGLSPHVRTQEPNLQSLASSLAKSFNQTVLADLGPLERSGLTVYDVPTYADLDRVASNPSYFASQYGITFNNVTDPGWTGNFTSSSSGVLRPDYQDYLFFDSVHPTALAHQLTADIAYHALTAAPLTASSPFFRDSSGDLAQYAVNGEPTLENVGWAAPNWQVAGVGDFDGNDANDVLFSDSSTGSLGQFVLNDGHPTWESIGSAALNWQVAGVGDFTGNGTDDILFRDPSTGSLGSFLMNDGKPTWEGVGQAAPNWQVVGVGDVTGNGTDDILFRDPSTGNVGAFIMNDDHPTWEGVGQAATNWQVAGVGDFTGNGTDDILFRDPSTGNLGAFMMNDGHPTWEGIGWAATNWQVVGVQDLLGNGADDILFRDPNTGSMGAFIMNDGHPTWEGLGEVATNWHMAWPGQPTRTG